MTHSPREPRGFALYVGISEADAQAAGISLQELVTELKKTVTDHVPATETHAAIALAPVGAGGKHLDIVRMALHDPIALGKLARDTKAQESKAQESLVVIDISRKRVLIDDEQAPAIPRSS